MISLFDNYVEAHLNFQMLDINPKNTNEVEVKVDFCFSPWKL